MIKEILNISIKGIVMIFIILSVYSCQRESNQNIEILSIGDPMKLKEFTDVFSDVELIFLDSTKDALLSSVEKMYVLNDTFYIKDGRSQNIFIYEKDGSFLSNTKRIRGCSGKEVQVISDFLVNPYAQNIEILNPYGAVYIYDKSINFVDKFRVPKECGMVHSFDIIDSCTYIFGGMASKGDNPTLYAYSKADNKVINKAVVEEIFPHRSICTDDNMFHKDNNNTYFISDRHHNMLFSLNPHDEKMLQAEYCFKLKNNPLTSDDINMSNLEQFREEDFSKYSSFNRRYISEKHIVVSYWYQKKINIYIYDRQTKKSICFNGEFDSGNRIGPPGVISDKSYYSIIEATWIPILFPHYSFDAVTAEKIEELSDSDNLVIVKYNFKDR